MYLDPDQATVCASIKANGGVTQRLMRNFGANSLGPVFTAVIQLGTVPLLLHSWGAAKYGDWLILFAIPSYLGLSDLGFGDASGSDMSMRVAANDREGALRTFQSSWVLVTAISVVALLLASLSVWWVPWQRWLKLSSVSSPQAASILLVLAVYVVVAQQIGVTESGYRCDGNFAVGTFWSAILRLAEATAGAAAAVLSGSLLAVAFTYLALRCLGTIGYALLLRRISPWIHYGVRRAHVETIKELAAPAFGFMAFPVGYALSLQGFAIMIGVLLGPVAVVAFSTLRTLSRFSTQLISVIKIGLWPELSRAFGVGNISLARRLHRRACQASIGFSLLGGLLLWIAGPFIYRVWIGHHAAFDATCFHVLLLVAVTNSLWDTSSIIPMSTNGHLRIALAFVGTSALSLALACLLVPRLGLVGAAMALVATDLWMTGLVLRTTLSQVQDSVSTFAAALFSVPPFRQFLKPAPEE
jgi:O-antigen/teichoic acid export membrane protein